MKKIQKLCFLALVGLMVGTSCEKTTATPDPNPQDKCIEGIVVAENYKISTDPNALRTCETIVQIKNRTMGIQFGKYSNCLTISNLDVSLQKIHQKIYFKNFTETPRCGPWQSDCFGGLPGCIIATNISTKCEAQ